MGLNKGVKPGGVGGRAAPAAVRPAPGAGRAAQAARPQTAKPNLGGAGAKPSGAAVSKPTPTRTAAQRKKDEEEKKADAAPRTPVVKKGVKAEPPKPTPPRAAGAKASFLNKPGAAAKPESSTKADPAKPKAQQSDWLIYLKQQGGPFPKDVKEAKIAECKVKYDKMKEE